MPDLDCVIEEVLEDIEFTEEDVAKELKKLKPDKSLGTDGIHPRVLRECCEDMAKPLFIIFKKTLETGKLSSDWKSARHTYRNV